MFRLRWTDEAKANFESLKSRASQEKRYKAVKKALRFLAANPQHNSLETHEFTSLKGLNGEKVWVAYAQQNTPAAYRIFWYCGPYKGMITILAITPHPN